MLHHHVSLLQGTAVDSESRLYFRAQPAANVQEITGQLTGPHCEFARTLPTTFAVRPSPSLSGEACLSEVLVTDPCFWTPRLPFLYNLKLRVTCLTGESINYEMAAGMKRWHVDGLHWKLERKRIVFRGAEPLGEGEKFLRSARQAETALLVPPPNETTLELASRLGIALLVDLCAPGVRTCDQPLDDTLDRLATRDRLAWSPAVMAVIGDVQRLTSKSLRTAHRATPLPLGLAVNAQSSENEVASIDCDFFAVRTRPGERPPAWLSDADKPVIVIRGGESYDNLAVARSRCDHLQAELTPEFDLAGYVVTP